MASQRPERCDVVIVGGGPAGLSAAVVLGRARRRVVLFDTNRPRNWASQGVHNYLSRDGIMPGELRGMGVEEAVRYGVAVRTGMVESVRWELGAGGGDGEKGDGSVPGTEPRGSPNGVVGPSANGGRFVVCVDGSCDLHARKVLLATGVVDVLPATPGFKEYYGRGVHHCPYCDAFEYSGKAMAAYGPGGGGKKGLGLALALRTWTEDVTVLTDGPARFSRSDAETMRRNGIRLRTERVARLDGTGAANGDGGRLERVVFEGARAGQEGGSMAVAALFFNTAQVQRSGLAAMLGCDFKRDGGVKTDDRQRTCVRGLFLAGDARREVQFAIVAAAEGATAAVAINRELQDEDRGVEGERAAKQPPGKLQRIGGGGVSGDGG